MILSFQFKSPKATGFIGSNAIRFGFAPRGRAIPAVSTEFITDTTILKLPVNCVLIGQQPLGVGESINDIRPMNIRTRPVLTRGR